MIPPQMGIACSICILVSPSMHAYWSCIVFMVPRADITAQFSGDSPPPTRRFSSSEVNHCLSQWCMIPPQMGIACSICILVSPSMHAYWSCIVFMVPRAGITAQFSGDSPPTRRFSSSEVNHCLRQWCMIPPQMGIACSICILVSPSMHAYWSCIVFMVPRADITAQFSGDSPPPTHRF